MTLFERLQQEWQSGLRPSVFPERLPVDEYGLAAVGGALLPELVVEAYSKGYFPWTGRHPVPWYSPDPRLILRPHEFYASSSLKKLSRKGRYRVVYDSDFRGVMEACGEMERPGQSGTWITDNMLEAYTELHRHGITHSVEVYRGETLVGGLYGLTLGRAFFGESMFSREPNTSKLALYILCQQLEQWGFAFVDCQQETPHLQSLGAYPITREQYLDELVEALEAPSQHYVWSHLS